MRRKNKDVEGGEGAEEGEAEKEKKDTLAVVVPCSSSTSSFPSSAVKATAAPIEQRRLEAQKHRHATVWTKDPHGGRHRPVRKKKMSKK